MKTILSTKKLNQSQQELVLNAGLALTHYNAITTKPLDFSLDLNNTTALIFTSQNGVLSFSKQFDSITYLKNIIFGIFCVGEKTKNLIQQLGASCLCCANNAYDLGQKIVKNYSHLSFVHITSNKARPELGTILTKNNIRYNKMVAYQTTLITKRFNSSFDGVLFFSPTGVQSYTNKNKIAGWAFCIGDTTANEIKKHTNKYIIAKKPTVENVLVQAVKTLSDD